MQNQQIMTKFVFGKPIHETMKVLLYRDTVYVNRKNIITIFIN